MIILADAELSEPALAGQRSVSPIASEPASWGESADDKLALHRLARSAARSAVKWPGRAWGAMDVFVAAASFILAHFCSPKFSFAIVPPVLIPLGAVVFAGSLLLMSYVLGAYDRHNFMFIVPMAGRTLAVNALALAMTSLAFGWFGYLQIGRLILVGTFVLSAGGTFALRMTARELARCAKIRLVLAGPRERFRPLAAQIRRLHSGFYERPVYVSPADLAAEAVGVFDGLKRFEPDEIVVMDDDPAMLDLLRDGSRILRSGCAIYSHSAYYEKLLWQVPVDSIDGRAILGNGFKPGSLHTGLAKRPVDMALSFVGLLIAAPLILLCCVLIKTTSRGPILYKQVRVGRYGRQFWIYKFRTMRTDAEVNGAVWARGHDARATRIGRFLRKSRFDELPQLWNILRGDMSLVGPRPERPEFVTLLRQRIPHYDLRHLVLPGLTGWAQVRFRYGATVADARRKLAFDLYYVRNCGLIFDAAICLRTLVAMAKGAR